jgi:alpha-beta hydrolase superfamily lysophospholipase
MKTRNWVWTSQDGLEMYAQSWEPEDASPKAVVCLVHGLGEHSGRYAHVGQTLADAGFTLAGFDLRGHGKSGGPRGHIPSFDAYMDDIAAFQKQIDERYSDTPCFLYGHSLGGILVLNYVLRRKPDFKGVISTGAGLRTSLEEQTVKVMMARLLGTLMPGVAIPSGLDPTTISRSPEVVDAYVNDPLVHDKMTFGFGKIMLSVIPWTFEHAHEFSLPLLMIHGKDDKLGYPRGSEEFASLVKQDCTLKLWDGMYHEIHNEPDQNEVLAFMIDWMNSQLMKE